MNCMAQTNIVQLSKGNCFHLTCSFDLILNWFVSSWGSLNSSVWRNNVNDWDKIFFKGHNVWQVLNKE